MGQAHVPGAGKGHRDAKALQAGGREAGDSSLFEKSAQILVGIRAAVVLMMVSCVDIMW